MAPKLEAIEIGGWSNYEPLRDSLPLKDSRELSERIEFNQSLTQWSECNLGVFKHPGVLMEEEDGVEARSESGVDVALGAVADHPAGVRCELVARDDLAVCGGVFFSDDFNRSEVRCEA